MLKVLFFARIKEQLDCGLLELEWRDAVVDLDTLQEQLCVEHGDKWREVLGQDNMIRAINQTVVDGNSPLQDGDEVAFFPPVTGG
jgi:molybdopterin synthase sulfur carrier subunit